MTTCPNCGHKITDEDKVCPQCGFNLEKYRQDFFTDAHQKAKYEDDETTRKMVSRLAYRQEFYPEKQNTTVGKMIAWIRQNATLVFLLGVLLLIIMSFSRPIAWICFLILMIWLLIVCDRAEKIEQYTVDQRLTAKINQLGSNVFNRVEGRNQKIRTRSQKFESQHPHFENHMAKVRARRSHHYNYVQLSVIFTAFVSLIVLFSGSGASIAEDLYTEKMTISKVLLDLANRLLASGQTSIYSLLIYVVWLCLILIPILVIYNIFRNDRKGNWLAFLFSLVETVFLIYLVFRMSTIERANTGMFRQITSQLRNEAISVGASTYFLLLANILTTGLSAYNLLGRRKQDE